MKFINSSKESFANFVPHECRITVTDNVVIKKNIQQ